MWTYYAAFFLPIVLCIVFFKRDKKIWIAAVPGSALFIGFVFLGLFMEKTLIVPKWNHALLVVVGFSFYALLWSLFCVFTALLLRFMMNKRK